MADFENGFDGTNPGRRTAVLIVAGEESAPDRAFNAIRKLFGTYFEQIIFVSIGLVDHASFDAPDAGGSDVGGGARRAARGAISGCVDRAREAGMAAIMCVAVGTDPTDEVEKLCVEFAERCPAAVFFLGKVVFENRRWYHALLHGRTGEAIQRRLERRGLPLAILPVVVPA
jgi:hypothetical protein